MVQVYSIALQFAVGSVSPSHATLRNVGQAADRARMATADAVEQGEIGRLMETLTPQQAGLPCWSSSLISLDERAAAGMALFLVL